MRRYLKFYRKESFREQTLTGVLTEHLFFYFVETECLTQTTEGRIWFFFHHSIGGRIHCVCDGEAQQQEQLSLWRLGSQWR